MNLLNQRMRLLSHRLLRGTSYWRHLPASFGSAPIKVSPEAALKYLKPTASAFTQDLLDVADKYVKQGATVWDVGANVGLFSVLSAVRAGPEGRVVAFEPDPFLLHLLQQTAEANSRRWSRIDVVPLAISDASGLAKFSISGSGRAMNFLQGHGRSGSSVRFTRFVPTTTLDLMLKEFPAPQVVKIDIEGAEVAALEGASQLINDVRPDMYIEVGLTQRDRAKELFTEARYRLFRYAAGDVVSAGECCSHTIAVPEERC